MRIGRTSTLIASLVLLACLVVSPACSSDSGGDDAGSSRASGAGSSGKPADAGQDDTLTGKITVSAAASLTEAFNEIITTFETEHDGVEVVANYGSSGKLAEQIRSGAPVDVAAFADTVPMGSLDTEGLLLEPSQVFARNKLVIVTKPGNPTKVTGLGDLAKEPTGVISLCQPSAPCGKFADQLLSTAGVVVDPGRVTRGEDVKATLGAVSEGDAGAGIVYVTDASATGERVESVQIPDAENLIAEYPIAVLKDSANPDLARAFTEFVLSDEGRSVLKRFGFLEPGK